MLYLTHDMGTVPFESTYTSVRHDTKSAATKSKKNTDCYVFRLEPVATVSDHWAVHARLDANGNYSKDTSESVKLMRAWAEGQYGLLNVKLGKLPNTVNLISITDDPYSGASRHLGHVSRLSQPRTVRVPMGHLR